MGGVATAVIYSKNFKYILFDNNSHESTGNQLTISNKLDFKKSLLDLDLKIFQFGKFSNYKEKLKSMLK